jgi:PAS domain S-box-containing protein
VLNFQRARLLAAFVFGLNLFLLISDYFTYQKGEWNVNRGYIYLFETHLGLGIGISMLLLMALFLMHSVSKQSSKQQTRRYGGYAILTSLFLLCLTALTSGGVDQLLHQQITVYILAVFSISALFYLKPHVSFVIYLCSYAVFWGCLIVFQPDYDMLRGHSINGALLALLAWFFSVTLYRLRIRDFLYQMNLEVMVEQRTEMLEELNAQLEEEVLERRRLDDEMSQFFKASPDLICFLNFDQVLVRENNSFQDLLGYLSEDVKMKPLIGLVHPEDRNLTESILEECLGKHERLAQLKNRLRREDGKYISVEWTLMPDYERQIIFAVGRDVTQRNLDQEKIFRLASIVESTDDGIIGMMTDGTILDWNRGAGQVYGYTAEEIIGESILAIIPAEKYHEIAEIFKKAMRGENISHLETLRRHKDGRDLEVSLTVSPIKDNLGKVIGVSTILRDISQQKQMERELFRLDRMNLIGEMAASISHEVRNPMTTVRGFLQLLYGKEECKPYRTYFDLMIEELDRANSIITEFLSISRTKMTERKKKNLNAIISSMLPLIEASAVGRNQLVRTELTEVPDLFLDDKEIRQVLLNLTRNGIEAMEEGKILYIHTYSTNEEVILEIQDEGKGIPAELIPKLGTPFFTTKEEGTGLGLAVCFGIAARHDARIEVESGESGSTVSVRFRR